jgi:hypothetical protein
MGQQIDQFSCPPGNDDLSRRLNAKTWKIEAKKKNHMKMDRLEGH